MTSTETQLHTQESSAFFPLTGQKWSQDKKAEVRGVLSLTDLNHLVTQNPVQALPWPQAQISAFSVLSLIRNASVISKPKLIEISLLPLGNSKEAWHKLVYPQDFTLPSCKMGLEVEVTGLS